MALSSAGRSSMKGHFEDDDLTKIRGIGPSTQKKLRDLLDVHTFQRLAHLSAVEIESHLKEEGRAVSRHEIQSWIVQAEKLAAASPAPLKQASAPRSPEPKPANGSDQLAQKNSDLDQPLLQESEPWQPMASFTLEYQYRHREGQDEERRTLIRHTETGEVMTWVGLSHDQIHPWISQYLGDESLSEPEMKMADPEAEGSNTSSAALENSGSDAEISEMAIAPQPETQPLSSNHLALSEPVVVSGIQLQASQPPQSGVAMIADESSGQLLGVLKSQLPFELNVFFELAGLTAAHLRQKPIAYQVKVFALHRSTGAVEVLGETGLRPLLEAQVSYSALLEDIVLSQPGIYRLQVLITLQGIFATPGFFEIPLLQVA